MLFWLAAQLGMHTICPWSLVLQYICQGVRFAVQQTVLGRHAYTDALPHTCWIQMPGLQGMEEVWGEGEHVQVIHPATECISGREHVSCAGSPPAGLSELCSLKRCCTLPSVSREYHGVLASLLHGSTLPLHIQ